MPREDETDNPSTGKQIPEAAKESSPSPVLARGGRDSSVNRGGGASVDPTVQEMGASSGNYLEEPSSATSDAVSEESMCSRCGRSKIRTDKDAKTPPPTQPICACDSDLHELQQEDDKRENLDAGDVSVSSDALSDDSVCPRCGGTKRSRSTGLKPTQFLCKCRFRRDEPQDIEDIPLQEMPGVVVSNEEIPEIETFGDQNPDLGGGELPPEEDPPENDPNEEQRREDRDEESLRVGSDFSCTNCQWKIILTIVSMLALIVGFFLYFIILHLLNKKATGGKGPRKQ